MSAATRMSAFNWCNPFDHVLPIPDGSITNTDRAHLWGMYSGIRPGGAAATANRTLTLGARPALILGAAGQTLVKKSVRTLEIQ